MPVDMRALNLSFSLILLFLSKGLYAQNAITILRGTSYQVRLTKPCETLRLAATLQANISKDSLLVTIADVKYDQHPDNIYITAFNGISLTREPVTNSVYLNVPIQNEPVLSPGTYTLTLQLRKANTPQEILQTFQLSIQARPAVVRAPSTVIVSKIEHFPFVTSTTGSPLFIQEQSGNAYIDQLNIRSVSLVDGAGQPVPAGILFRYPKKIEPGREAQVNYRDTGHFPLGKVIGNYELTAPQLADPVQIRMEITTKKGTGYLVTTIVLGLLFGYLLRTYFEKRVALNTARLKAIELIQYLEQELKNIQDEKYKNGIEAALQKLKIVAGNDKPDTLLSTITETETIAREAKQEFVQRQTRIQAELDAYHQLFTTAWSLPTSFATLVANAEIEVSRLKEESRTNPSKAEAQLAHSKIATREMLMTQMKALRNQLSDALTEIENAPIKFDQAKEIINQLTGLLPGLATEDPNIETRALLQSVHDSNVKASDLVFTIRMSAHSLLNSVEGCLKNSGVTLNDNKSVEELINQGNRFLNKLNVPPGQNTEVLGIISAEISLLKEKLQQAIVNQISLKPGTGDINQEKEIIDLVTAGSYIIASEKLTDYLRRNRQALVQPQSNLERIPSIQNRIHLSAPAAFENIMRNTQSTIILNEHRREPDFKDLYFHTQRNLATLGLMRTILAGIAITFIGYVIFSSSFIGTLGDFSGIFFWAFTLDVSIATLSTLVTRVAKT